MKIHPENTLLIFDEIQEVPKALSSLKYFYENAPQYHIICAGSLLGLALHGGTSFPVGKVDFEMITTFKTTYIEALKQYYYVGGMPEAVLHFSLNKDVTEVRNIQSRILVAYEQDFSKHAPYEIVPRIRMLWLSDCGLIHKVHRITTPHLPLKAYEDLKSFKIYLLDVGLLGCMTGLRATSILDGNALFKEFKGALTEQYVLQQLVPIHSISAYYYTNERGAAEIDFLIDNGEQIIPLEVKAETNLKAKSLRYYQEKYNPQSSVRTSMTDYKKEDWLLNLPLYGISEITTLTS